MNGIFSFMKNNGGWNRQETMLPEQHISSIIFEPSSQMLFAGSYNGKIFASADLGKNWEQKRSGHHRQGNLFPRQPIGRRQTESLCRDSTGAFVLQ